MSTQLTTTTAPATLAQLTREADAARMARYAEYLAFYNGDQWAQRRRAGETRLVVNYARTFIRKGVSYLFTSAPGFQVVDGQGRQAADAERVEGLLSEFYAEADLHALDYEAAIDAAVLGDGAFKTTWSSRAGRPVVGTVDPRALLAWFRPDDRRVPYRVIERLDMTAEEAALVYGLERLPAVAPSTAPARVLVIEEWTAERYRVEIGGTVVIDAANPYGWIPYDLLANVPRPFEAWGESDLVDLLDLCRELNQRMTTLSRILQVSGYPIAVLEGVEGSAGIRAEAGQVWELPEGARAYLLDMLQSQGVRLHIEVIEEIRRSMHDVGETPRTAFGDSGRTLSGAALEVEIQPLVQKVARKRHSWSSLYRRRNAKVLELLERFGGADVGGLRRTVPIWGAILPSDRTALVRDEAQLVSAGIHSRAHAADMLGDGDPAALFEEWLLEARAISDLQTARPATAADERDGGANGEFE